MRLAPGLFLCCACDVVFDLERIAPADNDAQIACSAFPATSWNAEPTGLAGADPALSSSGTELVITRSGDLYRSRYSTAWSAPTAITELNVVGEPDDSPAFPPGNDNALLWSTGFGGRIMLAVRSSASAKWFDNGPVPGFTPPAEDHQAGSPTIDSLGPRIVTSYRPKLDADDTLDLYEHESRSMVYYRVEPSTTLAVNSPVADRDPHLTRDGCALLFASNRDGGYDLFLATRASTDAPFDRPVKLQLSIGADDRETGPWLADDGRLFFARGAEGAEEVHVATPVL